MDATGLGSDMTSLETRTPESVTRFPQPRRIPLPFFNSPASPSPCPISPSTSPLRELSELWGESKNAAFPATFQAPVQTGAEEYWKQFHDGRPVSSLSALSTDAGTITAGPTPSPDEAGLAWQMHLSAADQYRTVSALGHRPPPGLENDTSPARAASCCGEPANVTSTTVQPTVTLATSAPSATIQCNVDASSTMDPFLVAAGDRKGEFSPWPTDTAAWTTAHSPAPHGLSPWPYSAFGSHVPDGYPMMMYPSSTIPPVYPSTQISPGSAAILSTSTPLPIAPLSIAPLRNAFNDNFLPYNQLGASMVATPASSTAQAFAHHVAVTPASSPAAVPPACDRTVAGAKHSRRGRRGAVAAHDAATQKPSNEAHSSPCNAESASTSVSRPIMKRSPFGDTFSPSGGVATRKVGNTAKQPGEKHPPAESERFPASTVVSMSTTQAGSKILQRTLLKGHPSVIQDVLDGIETELIALMCNMYGNYLCSLAFQACSMAQRQRMLEIVCAPTRFLWIGKDKWGTHALQALISLACTPRDEELLLDALRRSVPELSCDSNGMHVVQRAFQNCIIREQREISNFAPTIITEVARYLHTVAHNPHGLCILKRCISQARSDINSQRLLLQAMTCQALELIQGRFSNYAVQHALEEWGGEACMPIIQALRQWLVQLSIQKFASNVVEHMLRMAPPDAQRQMIEELTCAEQTPLLVSTVYGHFVARRVLKAAAPEQKVALERAIQHNLGSLRNRRLRQRMERALRGEHDDSETEGGDAGVGEELPHQHETSPFRVRFV